MFTGIVETQSAVYAHPAGEQTMKLVIVRPTGWDLQIGQSIAVNGACLTVTKFTEDSFTVVLMSETLRKTSFGSKVPEVVNLERAMLATDRFEGHIVQGHVDTVGEVTGILEGDGQYELSISFDASFDTLVVPKGSITIDGVSLTVVKADLAKLSVALILHTLKETTLGELREGDNVNLEFDVIGKYLQKFK